MITHPHISWHMPDLNSSDLKLVSQAFESGWISNGPYVSEFEDKICKLTGSKHALAVCNGTVALHLAMWGLEIGPGDEVIIPAFTFVAPASIAKLLGATVVSVDICPDSWCICPKSVREAITPKTKAIVAVHTYGNIANMSELLVISQETGIPLIEDAAESFGSLYDGQHSATIGQVGIYSFHATKNITTGEGGMVLTSDSDLYERMIAFREHGMKQRRTYWHDYAGHNFRLTNLQAALGCSQMDRFQLISQAKQNLHRNYLRTFSENETFIVQKFDPRVSPVLWAFAVLLNLELPDKQSRKIRDEVIALMSNDNIETRPGFVHLSDLPPFAHLPNECSNAVDVSARAIVLPSHTQITESDVNHVYQRLQFHTERVLKNV